MHRVWVVAIIMHVAISVTATGQGLNASLKPLLDQMQVDQRIVDILQATLTEAAQKNRNTPATDAAKARLHEVQVHMSQAILKMRELQALSQVGQPEAPSASDTSQALDTQFSRVLVKQQAALDEELKAVQAKLAAAQAGQPMNAGELAAIQAELARIQKTQEMLTLMIKTMEETKRAAIGNLRNSTGGALGRPGKTPGAKASTSGNSVFIPSSSSDNKTTAPEGAHTVQTPAPAALPTPSPSDETTSRGSSSDAKMGPLR